MLGLCWFINGFMFLPLMNLCRIIIISSLSVLLINVQLSIQSKIMASGLITSWQIEGEKVEAVTDFIFLGSKITTDSDCSHEIKRHLLLGRYNPLHFCIVRCNLSFFISNFVDLILLSFFLEESG